MNFQRVFKELSHPSPRAIYPCLPLALRRLRAKKRLS